MKKLGAGLDRRAALSAALSCLALIGLIFFPPIEGTFRVHANPSRISSAIAVHFQNSEDQTGLVCALTASLNPETNFEYLGSPWLNSAGVMFAAFALTEPNSVPTSATVGIFFGATIAVLCVVLHLLQFYHALPVAVFLTTVMFQCARLLRKGIRMNSGIKYCVAFLLASFVLTNTHFANACRISSNQKLPTYEENFKRAKSVFVGRIKSTRPSGKKTFLTQNDVVMSHVLEGQASFCVPRDSPRAAQLEKEFDEKFKTSRI